MLPDALAAGVPYDVFWHLSPKKLKAFYKAYKTKRELRDEENWYLGQYFFSAILSALDCFMNGDKAKTKYVEKPFTQNTSEFKKQEKNDFKESKEVVAVYEMKKRTRLIEKQGLPMSPV